MSQFSIVHSIKWNYIGALIKGLSQIAVLGIMSRLLSPKEFGLMSMALVTIKFGNFFSDFGIASSIQQKIEVTDQDIQAAFWLSSLAGLIFFLITIAIAPYLSSFFDTRDLTPIIQLISLSFLIIGLSSTSLGLLKRNMQFKYLSIVEIISYLISNGIVGIVLAYKGYGAYSLAVAYLSQLCIIFIAGYVKTRHSLKVNFRLANYKYILSFGGSYSIANFMTFIGSNIDSILIGKFFPVNVLGLWNRSRTLISMPSYNILISITRVLFPAYSKYQTDIRQFRILYLKSLVITGFFLIPTGAGMYAAAEQLVLVILGLKWREAIPFVKLSAIFVPLEMLASIAATGCSALGALSKQIRLQTCLLLLFAPIMVFFAIHHELNLILISLVAYYWLRFFIYILIIGKLLDITLRKHLHVLFSQTFCGIWIIVLINFIRNQFFYLKPLELLSLEVIISVIGFFIFMIVGTAKDLRKILYDQLKSRYANNNLIVLSKFFLK